MSNLGGRLVKEIPISILEQRERGWERDWGARHGCVSQEWSGIGKNGLRSPKWGGGVKNGWGS